MLSSGSSSESENEEIIQICQRLFRLRINFGFYSIFEFKEHFRMTSVQMEQQGGYCSFAFSSNLIPPTDQQKCNSI